MKSYREVTKLIVAVGQINLLLHIACAERSKVDIMLTTDDSLLKKAMEHMDFLKVKIENPVKWLMEVI